MTTKKVFIEIAERFYVLDHMQLKEIAQKLGLSDKTIQRWKAKYNWDKKRKQHTATKQMFHEELFVFARKIMQSIEYDMENAEKIDPSRMFALTKMIPLVLKLKSYEDVITKEQFDDSSKEITPDFIKEINEQFLGIKYDKE